MKHDHVVKPVQFLLDVLDHIDEKTYGYKLLLFLTNWELY